MGSLWYHGHTICVSQGLTLSTAGLVFLMSPIIIFLEGVHFLTHDSCTFSIWKFKTKELAIREVLFLVSVNRVGFFLKVGADIPVIKTL